MKKLMPVLVVLALILTLAMPAWALVGAQVHPPDDDSSYTTTSEGWITGLYVAKVVCSNRLTVVYFTSGMYLYFKYYNSAMVLLAQNALYANRALAILVSNNVVAAYRVE